MIYLKKKKRDQLIQKICSDPQKTIMRYFPKLWLSGSLLLMATWSIYYLYMINILKLWENSEVYTSKSKLCLSKDIEVWGAFLFLCPLYLSLFSKFSTAIIVLHYIDDSQWISTSWYSLPCIVPSPWIWEGPGIHIECRKSDVKPVLNLSLSSSQALHNYHEKQLPCWWQHVQEPLEDQLYILYF